MRNLVLTQRSEIGSAGTDRFYCEQSLITLRLGKRTFENDFIIIYHNIQFSTDVYISFYWHFGIIAILQLKSDFRPE